MHTLSEDAASTKGDFALWSSNNAFLTNGDHALEMCIYDKPLLRVSVSVGEAGHDVLKWRRTPI